jgi:hypothetical protein
MTYTYTYLSFILTFMLVFTACESSEEESSNSQSEQTDVDTNAGQMNTDSDAGQMNTDTNAGQMEVNNSINEPNDIPEEVTLASLKVVADRDVTRYNTSTLSVMAVMSDASEMTVTEGLTWSSADDTIATVDETGMVYGVRMGDAQITASYEGIEATWSGTVGCRYPNFPNALRINNVVPAIGWNDAHRPDGTQFRFTLEDFYCSDEWDEYTSIIFMIKAAWCAPCTSYAQGRLNPAAESLQANGAMIIYVESQDLDYELADSAYAHNHMSSLIGDGIGLRVGDKSTIATPSGDVSIPGYIQDTDFIQAFPTIFIVRRSDMKLIADSSRFSLPLEDVIADLEADWSEPNVPMFTNNCEEGDEEASEPNNSFQEATPVSAGTYSGGICDQEPDIYLVEEAGDWIATLDFSHATGDLDVDVYPIGSNQAVISSDSSDDGEIVEYSGPVQLFIYGFNGASAPYSLTIEVLQ